MRARRNRDRRDEEGTALVETMLILTVVMTLLLAGFEFGRGFHAYLGVTEAARDGARTSLDATKSDADIQAAAVAAAAPLSVSVSVVRVSGEVSVTVTHAFQPVIGLLGPMTMSRTARAK
jgi:Flp pilus assembly protein TadG